MNKTILIGRLTKDPDCHGGETPFARYTLAVDRFGEGTDFIPCVAFKKGAEFAEKYLKKGTKIAVVGRIQTGKYTNRDGQTVYTTDVIVESQEFCESKKASEENTPSTPPNPDDFVKIPDNVDEELPFH